MDEKLDKPCWNITAWALTVFALIVCVIALMSGAGTEVVSAASTPIS